MEKTIIIRLYHIIVFGFVVLLIGGCTKQQPSWYMQPHETSNYCGDGKSSTIQQAKVVAIQDLVQSIGISVQSIDKRYSLTSSNGNSESFSKNITIANVVEELNNFEIEQYSEIKGIFSNEYYVQVCTPKKSVVEKLVTDIDKDFNSILQRYPNSNLLPKIDRDKEIAKINRVYEKIGILSIVENNFPLDRNITTNLSKIKQDLISKRKIRIVSEPFAKNTLEMMVTHLGAVVAKDEGEYTLFYQSKQEYKRYPRDGNMLVKLQSVLILKDSENRKLLSYSLDTIGEAKTKKSALYNAFEKFKKRIEDIKSIEESIAML